VRLRDRARSHFTGDAEWTARAAHVDHRVTESELGALLLECRLVKELRPPGNTLLKRERDGLVYLRCRLDIPFPILEVSRDPVAGNGLAIGPVRGRAAAAELVEQLNSLFGLRHCGRGLPRRSHPSPYGEMGRCLSPCLGDLDPTSTASASTRRWPCSPTTARGAAGHLDARCGQRRRRSSSSAPRGSSAASASSAAAPPGRCPARHHAGAPRCGAAPRAAGRFDAGGWWAGGW
jgi:hypothetical protein